jgi:low affinity Fe/Cu permease
MNRLNEKSMNSVFKRTGIPNSKIINMDTEKIDRKIEEKIRKKIHMPNYLKFLP